jgi:proteasome accessory factor C
MVVNEITILIGCGMKLDRFQQLHRLFKSHRRPISLVRLAERMECTEKTVRRTIEELQNYFDAPIEYDQKAKGWCYASSAEQFEMPGMWLTSSELQSLTLLLHVLENFSNGLLSDELVVVEKQIHKLLQARGISSEEFARHIKVLPLGNRQLEGKIFQQISDALLKRKKINIHYQNYNASKTRRYISPQTLIYYRENWYLDAWCHLRNDLRTFSLARIKRIESLEEKAIDISDEQLKTHFSKSYGIFSGEASNTAKLRFLPEVAHEIALQQWHPEQQGCWEGDSYLLMFPYCDDRELVGDIMRFLPNVVVEAPSSLRKAVSERLGKSIKFYK